MVLWYIIFYSYSGKKVLLCFSLQTTTKSKASWLLPTTLSVKVWFILPYGLVTTQVYFPLSSGTTFLSLRNHSELLTYGSIRQTNLWPSFNHLNWSGGAPVASHFSLMVWDAGHALYRLFRNLWSVKDGGASKTSQRQWFSSKAQVALIRRCCYISVKRDIFFCSSL